MSFIGNAVGDIVGGITGANQQADAAQSAANTQSSAANHAADLQWQQFQQLQQNLAPYMNLGSSSIGGLQSLLNNGSLTQQFSFNPTEQQLEQTPGYQFTLNQGMKNVNNQLAAKGLNLSGAQAKGLASYTTGLADQTYQQQYQNALQNFMTNYGVNSDQYNRLSGLVGLGENAAAGVGNAGLSTANNVGNLLTSSANSQGAAQIAAGNVAGNSLNSALGLGLSGAGIYSLLGGGAAAAGGLGSLGGLAAMGLSDAREKRDIRYLGNTEEGNRVYSFRYKDSKEKHIGVMAQEAERKNPGSVMDFAGVKYVDYSKVH